MNPIVISLEGDELEPVEGTTEESQLSEFLGFHKRCGGEIRLFLASEKYNRLHCNRCGMTDPVPTSVKTYKELKRCAESHIWEEQMRRKPSRISGELI